MKRAMYILLMCSFTVACGAGGSGEPSLRNGSDGGALQLTVANAKGRIDATARTAPAQFRVVVTGDAMAPVEAIFDASAESGVVEGIPPGADRRVEVTAINSNKEIIRSGTAEGVEVRGGEVANVTVALEQVPLFANVAEGGVVPNTRLRLEIIAAPGDPIAVEAGAITTTDVAGRADQFHPLVDISLNATEVRTDIASGLAVLRPARLSPGRYQFVARDQRSGRRSSLTLQITDGTKRRGAPLVSAGGDITRVGQPLIGGLHTGARWPQVVQILVGDF